MRRCSSSPSSWRLTEGSDRFERTSRRREAPRLHHFHEGRHRRYAVHVTCSVNRNCRARVSQPRSRRPSRLPPPLDCGEPACPAGRTRPRLGASSPPQSGQLEPSRPAPDPFQRIETSGESAFGEWRRSKRQGFARETLRPPLLEVARWTCGEISVLFRKLKTQSRVEMIDSCFAATLRCH